MATPYITTLGDRRPASCTVTLNSNAGQSTATTTWNELVDIPNEPADFLEHEPIPGQVFREPDFGQWVPVSTRKILRGGVWEQTTSWATQINTNGVLAKLTDSEHIKSEIAKLIKYEIDLAELAILTSDPDADNPALDLVTNARDRTLTNELGVWNRIEASAPNSGAPNVYSALLESIKNGDWLAELIASDLGKVTRLNTAIAQLADYQLVLQPITSTLSLVPPGTLAFLLDKGTPKVIEFNSEWDESDNLEIKDDSLFICHYLITDDRTGTLSVRGNSVVPNLTSVQLDLEPNYFLIEERANSYAEAELEIALQRTKRLANKRQAGATYPITSKLYPLDTLLVRDELWKVLRVTHSWPASGPETTSVQLRYLGPAETEEA